MPENRLQRIIFMFLTVLFSVIAFVNYNIAIMKGAMSSKIFIISLKEIPLEFVFAFLLQFLFVNNFAVKKAFKIVDPDDKPIFIVLAITCITIMIMCPAMSFIATLLHNSFSSDLISVWLKKIIINFPFAFFIQIFVIGPLVRTIINLVFNNVPSEQKPA